MYLLRLFHGRQYFSEVYLNHCNAEAKFQGRAKDACCANSSSGCENTAKHVFGERHSCSIDLSSRGHLGKLRPLSLYSSLSPLHPSSSNDPPGIRLGAELFGRRAAAQFLHRGALNVALAPRSLPAEPTPEYKARCQRRSGGTDALGCVVVCFVLP